MTMLATEAAGTAAGKDIGKDVAKRQPGSTSSVPVKAKGPKAPAKPRYSSESARVSQHFTGSSRQGTGVSRRTSGGKTSRKKGIAGGKFPKLSSAKAGSPQVSTLIAEWLIAVVLIMWGVLSGNKSYVEGMQNALWRMTALSGVFFVLALVMRGKNTGRVAIAFGALIDLALILQAVNRDEIKSLANVFSEKPSGGSTEGIVLDASKGPTDSAPQEETVHHIGDESAAAPAPKDKGKG